MRVALWVGDVEKGARCWVVSWKRLGSRLRVAEGDGDVGDEDGSGVFERIVGRTCREAVLAGEKRWRRMKPDMVSRCWRVVGDAMGGGEPRCDAMRWAMMVAVGGGFFWAWGVSRDHVTVSARTRGFMLTGLAVYQRNVDEILP